VLATPSNSSGTLNPEAHEFKYKSLSGNPSKSEELRQTKPGIVKKSKGKYYLKTKQNRS